MRSHVFAAAAVSACLFVSMAPDARADAFLAGATVGLAGSAVIGAAASPYYYGPYGYAPSYYHGVPSFAISAPVAYGYSYSVPTYGYSQPYYVASPCWGRRLPVYDRYGGVVAVRYENSCR